ncbi:hypothetical protein DFA_02820 [Cavenderia fasciculata]|uniref:Uncharacterized protein n=1 Tax=Cavenderia fasciculata TaxID=261658 RepID=F4PIJ7_CACFS|nr:uncharacterized protein DFA_02820 [Cavenderia fasciculata]EGG24577.1 hypothetical protein DFA_02820 [Cavenderia fasciculata]|eukprot:XP_004362428.1 hypothetical protein DFA_02820 [Cavenderia fasciculata]
MGILFSKFNPSTGYLEKMNKLSATNQDESRVGDVYLVTYEFQPDSYSTPYSPHYTIVVDLCGESTEKLPKGMEIHINPLKDFSLQLCIERLDRLPKSKDLSFQKLGRIENQYHPGNPREWCVALGSVVENSWFPEFTTLKGKFWNRTCHSDQFAKF